MNLFNSLKYEPRRSHDLESIVRVIMFLHYKHIILPDLPILANLPQNENKNKDMVDIDLLKQRVQNVQNMWKRVDNYLKGRGNNFWSKALDYAENGKFDELNEHIKSSHYFQETFKV